MYYPVIQNSKEVCAMIENYQSKILNPDEIVDYSTEMICSVRPETIQMEPMIGFKILTRDMRAFASTQAARFQFLEANLAFLRDTGCIIRETHPIEAKDGFWLITFPVPLSQLSNQLMKLTKVLDFMTTRFGIVPQNLIEINVSGRCPVAETEWRLQNVNIPQDMRRFIVEPANTPYKMGHIIRINEGYAMLRTMWDWRTDQAAKSHINEMLIIPQLIAGMFH
jgi:hypothetical protein